MDIPDIVSRNGLENKHDNFTYINYFHVGVVFAVIYYI